MDTAEKLPVGIEERALENSSPSRSHRLGVGVSQFIENLLRNLTGSDAAGATLRDSFESLLDKLGAHESIRRAGKILLSQSESLPIHQVESLSSVLRSFVTSRKELAGRVGDAFFDDTERFLSFRHTHDDSASSYTGIKAEISLKLIGRASQPLWCKMFLRTNGKFVNVRDGWESWSDSVEKMPVTALGAASRVCVFTPLHVDRQRWHSEHFSLFIPYSAMNLPTGRTDFEIEAGVYDGRGTRIVSERGTGLYFIPDYENRTPIPSPQSRDAWEYDPSSGSRIRVEEISHLGSKGSSRGRLSTLLTFTLNGFEGECLTLEGRLMQRNGEYITSSVPEWMDRDGIFVSRISLLPKLPVETFPGLEMTLPMDALRIESKEALFLDLTLRTLDGRIVCGATYPVAI